MASFSATFATAIAVLFFFAQSNGSYAGQITILNKSKYQIWPVVMSTAGSEASPASFTLQRGESGGVVVPPAFSVKIWARTFCSQSQGGELACATGGGNCASATMPCGATVVDVAMSNAGDVNLYKVTLAYGYNLAVKVDPDNYPGSICTSLNCAVNVNKTCPEEFQVIAGLGGEVLGCNTNFSNSTEVFNTTCSYNDMVFNCSVTNYTITFDSTRSMDSAPTAGNDIDKMLLDAVKWVGGIVISLLGGYTFYKAGCYFYFECKGGCNAGNA